MHSETKRLRNILTHVMRGGSRDVVGGWDEMQGYGDDTYGDTVGAWMPAQMFRPGMPPAMPFNPAMRRLPGPPILSPNNIQANQGGPRRLLSYMGLGTLTWTHADTVTEKSVVAEPQAAFRGRRLVIAQSKSSGAVGIAATITKPLTVSGMPQTPAPDQAAPVEMFDAATTYSMLDLQIATSATQVSIGISVSAIPASGETVVVACGLYGEWLR